MADVPVHEGPEQVVQFLRSGVAALRHNAVFELRVDVVAASAGIDDVLRRIVPQISQGAAAVAVSVPVGFPDLKAVPAIFAYSGQIHGELSGVGGS